MTGRAPDLYAILGVPPDATQEQISHAYRTLLRRHHPDTRADDDTAVASDSALQEVFSAYAVLRDRERRAAYDRQLVAAAARTAISPSEPRHHVAVRVRPAPQPPIVAGPVRWHRGDGRR
jgi:DnaJ-class molecular chaperone